MKTWHLVQITRDPFVSTSATGLLVWRHHPAPLRLSRASCRPSLANGTWRDRWRQLIWRTRALCQPTRDKWLHVNPNGPAPKKKPHASAEESLTSAWWRRR